jgi:fucose 4-O-acetylase-like acetyltransferase
MVKAFSMPMFMMLSGFVISSKKLDEAWLYKKLKKFGLILLICSTGYWLWATLVPNWSMLKVSTSFLNYQTYAFSTGFTDTVLWYVFVLLQCYIVLWFSNAATKIWPKLNISIPIIASMVILNCIPLYLILGYGWLKWYGLFMLAGYLAGLCKETLKKWLWITYPAIGGFAVMGYLTGWMTNWQNLEFGLGGHTVILKAISGGQFALLGVMFGIIILGTLAFIGVARLLNKIKYLKAILAYVGSCSLGVYLIHPLFAGINSNIFVTSLLDIGLCLVLYIAGRYVISKIKGIKRLKAVAA